MSEAAAVQYVLPSALVTRADLARLVREVEALDNELEAQKARNHTTGQTGYHLPNISQGLTDFAEINKLDLSDDRARMTLKEHMKVMKDKAPIVHMTFAVDADPESLQFIVQYMRKELHPQALLSVGLQPGLIGGVYMRTPNHVHDFSMRARLAQSRVVIQQDMDQLLQQIPMPGVVTAGLTTAMGALPVAEAPKESD